jgi:hypothetical protein
MGTCLRLREVGSKERQAVAQLAQSPTVAVHLVERVRRTRCAPREMSKSI